MAEEDPTQQPPSVSPAESASPTPPVSPPAVPPASVKVGDATEISRMRKSLGIEIKELRKQVLLVQLQSMKVMQQSIHSIFKTQTQKTAEQITQQNEDLQKNIEEETQEPEPGTQNNTSHTGESTDDEDGQIKVFNEIVLGALQSAQKSIDNAMTYTQHILTEARNRLKDT